MSELPSVTIVMPAYNASHFVKKTVPAALEAAARVPGTQLLVVDPGSTDDTSEVVRAFGAAVHRLPERAGPARARNEGVERIDSEVVLFIDSDCVAHPDVVERVAAAFAADDELVSLIGSYDDDPPEQNFFSLYMNLRHHLTHQKANQDRAGFWAGCGAVRRSAFNRIGGFDPVRYPMPMIEDIHLGMRLLPLGNCKLDPALHVTHLKLWTMRGVIETDIKCRAIPWGELLLESGEIPNDLNLRWSARIAAALSPIVLLGVLAMPVALLLGFPLLALPFALATGLSMFLQRQAIAELVRMRGVWFAMRYYLFHQVHLFYSATTMALLTLRHMLKPKQGADLPGAPG